MLDAAFRGDQPPSISFFQTLPPKTSKEFIAPLLPPEGMTERMANYLNENVNQLAQKILGLSPDQLNEIIPEQTQREIRQLAESEWGIASLMKFLETLHEQQGQDAGVAALAYIKNLALDPSIDKQAQHKLHNTIKIVYQLILEFRQLIMKALFEDLPRQTADALHRVIADWIDSLAKNDPELLGAGMATLRIHTTEQSWFSLKKFVEEAYREITARNQARMAAEGESRAERTAHRTPMDVTVNALSLVNKVMSHDPQSPYIDSLLEIKKSLTTALITRQVDLENTKDTMQWLIKKADELGLKDLSESIAVLVSQLPKTEERLTPAQMHDSIYARVIDTTIIWRLIKDPPKKVKEALGVGGKYMSWWLERCMNPKYQDKIFWQFGPLVAEELRDFFNHFDPRFWCANIPDMRAFLETSNRDTAFKSLYRILRKEPQSGLECVMMSSLLIKTSWICQEQRREVLNPMAPLHWSKLVGEQWKLAAPWMENARETYEMKILPQTSRAKCISGIDPEGRRVTVLKQGEKKKLGTEAGITLPHQPAVIYGDYGATATERPVARNLLNIDEASIPVSKALMQGHAWAAGPSGSMNIALHFLHHFLSEANKGHEGQDLIQPKDFLLGIMMFLTYDGGHSLNESLFAANLLNKELDLGLTMKGTDDPNEFVADLASFIGMYDEDEETRNKLEEAFTGAIEDVVQYFEQYSYFRNI